MMYNTTVSAGLIDIHTEQCRQIYTTVAYTVRRESIRLSNYCIACIKKTHKTR